MSAAPPRCRDCRRPVIRTETVEGYGPRCARKRGLIDARPRIRRPEVGRLDQDPLFDLEVPIMTDQPADHGGHPSPHPPLYLVVIVGEGPKFTYSLAHAEDWARRNAGIVCQLSVVVDYHPASESARDQVEVPGGE